jgi:hypothetical protein
MGYQNRRYRVNKDGKFEKRWDGTDEPGWYMTKEAAMDAFTAPLEAAEKPRKPRAPKPAARAEAETLE